MGTIFYAIADGFEDGIVLTQARHCNEEEQYELSEFYQEYALFPEGKPLPLLYLTPDDLPDRPEDGTFLKLNNHVWLLDENERQRYLNLNQARYDAEDEIKKQVQGLVRTGHIRHIYSISLGYVLFDTREEGEYLLAPCWVFWCRYHPEGGAAEETYGINSERVMFYGNNAYYRAIIFDAQTGRMFDTEDSSRERFLYPGYVE